MTDDAPIRIAFVCVENAGRSQMAAAFAERERDRRGLETVVEITSGGTRPAEHVHETVVAAMAEVGVDIAARTPRAISSAELESVDIVVTMGCSAGDVCPATLRGDARDWALDDPGPRGLPAVRAIRDEVDSRVIALLDELEAGLDDVVDSPERMAGDPESTRRS